MSPIKENRFQIEIKTRYLPEQSEPEGSRFAFAYTITLTNNGILSAQLLTRHWIITDADDHVQEVMGEGVIGEKPVIPPGKSFTYTSGAVLKTENGHMQGSYQMVNEQGDPFDAEIPAFTLATPHSLH